MMIKLLCSGKIFVQLLLILSCILTSAMTVHANSMYLILPCQRSGGDANQEWVLLKLADSEVKDVEVFPNLVAYGIGKDTLVMVSESLEGSQLIFWDLRSGEKVRESNLESIKVLSMIAGPAEHPIFGEDDDKLYFRGATFKPTVAMRLYIMEVDSENTKPYLLPEHAGSDRLLPLPNAIGMYSAGSNISIFSTTKNKFTNTLKRGLPHSQALYLRNFGVLLWDKGGNYQRIADTKLNPTDDVVEAIGLPVEMMLTAEINETPVLIVAKKSAADSGISAIIAYDPVAKKQLWELSLPFMAESFAVSPNGRMLYFLTNENNNAKLIVYDRQTKKYTEEVKIPCKLGKNGKGMIIPS